MSAPTSAAVEAVQRVKLELVALLANNAPINFAVPRLIAAMLDNMPREVMADAMRAWDDAGPRDPGYGALLDAAISAARKELLGHD